MTETFEPIVPEPINEDSDRYEAGHWDYPTRCADVDRALADARDKVEEWDRDADPHGWWHDRPTLIALYNEVVRLRGQT